MELRPKWGNAQGIEMLWTGEGKLRERRMKVGEFLRGVRVGFPEEGSSSAMRRDCLSEQHI